MALWIKTPDGTIERAAGGAFLPLVGGTLTGNLQVDGVTTTTGLDAKANGSASPTNPNITFGTSGVNAQTGFYRNSTGAVQVACEGEPVARFGLGQLTLYNSLRVDTYASIGGAVVQGFFFNVAARSAEYIEWPSSIAFGQIQLAGNTVSTTGSALLHYRSNQGYTVESGKRLRTTDGTMFQDAGVELVGNTAAPKGTTYPDGHITVVPHSTGDKYRIYIENNTDADRSWVGMWMGTAPITGSSSGVTRSAADIKELEGIEMGSWLKKDGTP
jgi:hypothetical protein